MAVQGEKPLFALVCLSLTVLNSSLGPMSPQGLRELRTLYWGLCHHKACESYEVFTGAFRTPHWGLCHCKAAYKSSHFSVEGYKDQLVVFVQGRQGMDNRHSGGDRDTHLAFRLEICIILTFLILLTLPGSYPLPSFVIHVLVWMISST